MSNRMAILCLVVVVSVALVGSRFTQPAATSPKLSDEILPIACEDISQDARFQAADLILTGSVFVVLSNPNGSADVLITPAEVLKGTVPEGGVALAARPTSSGGALNPTADLHFTSQDAPYFLVLTQREDGRYNTDSCAGSRLLGDGLRDDERDSIANLAR